MAEKRKRKSISPESERIEKLVEDVEDAELSRAANALSLAESKRKVPDELGYGIGYDPDITHIPKQKMGERGYKLELADKNQTVFNHLKTGSGVMTQVQRICWTLDGYGPGDDIEKQIDLFEASDLRKSFGLALMEIGGLDDPMLELIEEATESRYSVDVSEKDYCELRNDELYTQSCISFMSDPLTKSLTKGELLNMLKKARQEIAWLKDNRDYLSDYMDMAEEFHAEGIEHKLKYNFYPRVSYIELLENDIREHVRRGAKTEKAQETESDVSASKRKRTDLEQ